MKTTVDKKELIKAFECMSFLNNKGKEDVDNSIIVSADYNGLFVSGGNGSGIAEISIDAETSEPGEIIIQNNYLDKKIKNFQDKEVVISGNDERIRFDSLNNKSTIVVQKKETQKFDRFNKKEHDLTAAVPAVSFNVKESTVSYFLSASSSCVNQKAPKEELRCTAIILSQKKVDFVGFSAKKMCVCRMKKDEIKNNLTIAVPLMFSKMLSKITEKKDSNVNISVYEEKNEIWTLFKNDMFSLMLMSKKCEYPHYESFINKNLDSGVVFDSKSAISAIKKIIPTSQCELSISADKNGDVEFKIEQNNFCQTTTEKAKIKGQPFEMTVVGKDFKDALGFVLGEACEIGYIVEGLFSITSQNYKFISTVIDEKK